MNKRALYALAGVLGFAFPLAAQQFAERNEFTSQPSRGSDFQQVDVSLGRTWSGFPSLSLANRDRFSLPGSFSWMTAQPDLLPALTSYEPRRRQPMREPIASDEVASFAEMETRKKLFYTGGEAGFVYGRYTGKNGGDFKTGYILGEIGNDHFRLSVGASYGERSGGDRRGRR